MEDFFIVPSKKSSYYAKKYRNIGNAKLKKRKYFEALENFNKSLCLAEIFSEDASLAYASRSKVFAEVDEAKVRSKSRVKTSCLNDSDSKINFNKIFDEKLETSNFFQLSYPPNEKLPFVANCLELRNDVNFGRYITTKHCLKPGDVIAIEEPFFKIVENSANHLRCANCLRSNKMNLIPSSLTSSSKSFYTVLFQWYKEGFLYFQVCFVQKNACEKRRRIFIKQKLI